MEERARIVGSVGSSRSLVSLFGLVAGISGCTDGGPGGEGSAAVLREPLTLQFSLALPQGLHPTDVAVAAEQVILDDRVRVLEGDSETEFASTWSSGPGQQFATVVGSQTQTGTILSGGGVWLRDGCTVNGSVYTSQPITTQNQTSVTGHQKIDVQFPADSTWTRQITWPTIISQPPPMEPWQQPAVVELPPGAYTTIQVKSGRTLRLSSGTYYIGGPGLPGTFGFEPQAGLDIDATDGPVTVYLTGDIYFRGIISGAAAPDMPIPSLTILTSSSNPQFIERTFTGVVIAPNAPISMDVSAANLRGAFFGGWTINVHQDARIRHERDPYTFRDFWPSGGTGTTNERVSVTGASVRLGPQVTDEYGQAEAAASVGRAPDGSYLVTVTYNDRTQDPAAELIEHPPPEEAPDDDGRDGIRRLIHRGASLMGWSYSTNGGYTFNYGGRVAPPAGFAAILGDPAIARADVDDDHVYMAQMAMTDEQFGLNEGYQPGSDTIEDATPIPNGYCVARSIDSGVTFPAVSCVEDISHDGTGLAVAVDSSQVRQVYLAGNKRGLPPEFNPAVFDVSVWRMDGDAMTFTLLPSPYAASRQMQLHPRLRVHDGTLYVLDLDTTSGASGVVVNRLDATNNSETWLGESVIPTTGIVVRTIPLDDPGDDDRTLAQANPFSFDFGPNDTGQIRLRIAYTGVDGDGSFGLRGLECLPEDPSSCIGLPSLAVATNDMTPSMRFGGDWLMTWWRHQPGTNQVATIAGRWTAGGVEEHALSFPTNPCSTLDLVDPPDDAFWADYNEIDAFGDGRFFAPYTVNGPGCRFQGAYTADMHVGGSVCAF